MRDLRKIVQKHLSKAKRAYNKHLADKNDLNGPYLVGQYSALYELAKDLELKSDKAKAKKARP